jgi:hypothetical protein
MHFPNRFCGSWQPGPVSPWSHGGYLSLIRIATTGNPARYPGLNVGFNPADGTRSQLNTPPKAINRLQFVNEGATESSLQTCGRRKTWNVDEVEAGAEWYSDFGR